MNQKYNSALGAFEILSNVPGPFNIGIGTGSTTDFFTKEFLPNIKNSLSDIYSSSIRTTNLLNELGFVVKELGEDSIVDFYIDGADEVDKTLALIKGGGGAHTSEKRIAKKAKKFICIVDETKIVSDLGEVPLPIEIQDSHKKQIIESLKNLTNKITVREYKSDLNNTIIDLHHLVIDNPDELEADILNIKGVIDVGIFAVDRPNIVIVGQDSGYRLIES